MTDYSDLPDPARHHITAAARRLDELARQAQEVEDHKTRARASFPPELAESLCDLLDLGGALIQDAVHTRRAQLARVADLARAEQREQSQGRDDSVDQ